MTRKLCIPLLVVLALLATTSSAAASTTIGAALTGTPALYPSNCAVVSGGIPVSCTVYINTITDPAEMAPGGLFSPTDGVITRWRLAMGVSTASSIAVTPRVLGFTNKYTALRSGTPQSIPIAGGTFEFPTRLSIPANGMFAIDAVTNGAVGDAPKFVANIGSNAGLVAKTPAVPDGGTFGVTLGAPNTSKLMINADIEPDADKDGYGDETQDLCVTSAAAHGPCPAPVITAPKAAKGGFTFTSDLPGKATTTLFRTTTGRKVGKKCKKGKPKKGKSCKRYVKFAQWSDDVVAGANSISYAYKVGGKSLKKGSYRATIAIVTAQLTVTTTNIDFKVK